MMMMGAMGLDSDFIGEAKGYSNKSKKGCKKNK